MEHTCLRLAILLGAVGCYDDVKVIQGTVALLDAENRSVTVEDERAPHARVTLYLSESPGKVGSKVRIAYRQKDGKLVVLRLQNLSRTADRRGE